MSRMTQTWRTLWNKLDLWQRAWLYFIAMTKSVITTIGIWPRWPRTRAGRAGERDILVTSFHTLTCEIVRETNTSSEHLVRDYFTISLSFRKTVTKWFFSWTISQAFIVILWNRPWKTNHFVTFILNESWNREILPEITLGCDVFPEEEVLRKSSYIPCKFVKLILTRQFLKHAVKYCVTSGHFSCFHRDCQEFWELCGV